MIRMNPGSVMGFFSQKLHIKCSSSSQENGQWKITMYPFTVSMDMVQVSNVKIILCFHEEILKMGTSSEILIFRSAVMWLSIFKTIRLLYLMRLISSSKCDTAPQDLLLFITKRSG
ncbi:hypothetical protein NC652_025645 [Populus alba x Populus x berolinensis]|nr:hypothetical protein NC652_025645 [Populus alba x Populus x berolinensis]